MCYVSCTFFEHLAVVTCEGKGTMHTASIWFNSDRLFSIAFACKFQGCRQCRSSIDVQSSTVEVAAAFNFSDFERGSRRRQKRVSLFNQAIALFGQYSGHTWCEHTRRQRTGGGPFLGSRGAIHIRQKKREAPREGVAGSSNPKALQTRPKLPAVPPSVVLSRPVTVIIIRPPFSFSFPFSFPLFVIFILHQQSNPASAFKRLEHSYLNTQLKAPLTCKFPAFLRFTLSTRRCLPRLQGLR